MLNFIKNLFKTSRTGYEEWYISQASDLYDLERRQKKMDELRRKNRINNINYI